MNKYIFYLILQFLVLGGSSQCLSIDPSAPCCNELINIDPHNSNVFTNNNERTDINFYQTNFLEWVNTAKPNFLYNKTPGSSPLILVNPWLQYNSSLYPFFTNFSITGFPKDPNGIDLPSNMHPRYGWQLLHSSTNYEPYSTSPLAASSTGFSNGPYFLYYNKYTGHLRAMVYPEGYSGANSMQFRLGFNTNKSYTNNNNSWYASGIFNTYDRMQALDELTKINNVYAIADNTQGGGDSRPFMGDFQLSYDPCVCNTLPELEFDIQTRTSEKFYAEGKLAAVSSPFNNSGTAPYHFGKDYMASVYQDLTSNNPFDLGNGLLVYNKVDQWTKDFYVSEGRQALAGALGFFGKAVNGISLGSGLSPATLLKDMGFLSNLSSDTNEIKIPIGNILSGGFDRLSAAINPPTPNVFLIEGQMALRGEITNSFNWAGFSKKNIGHPGSPINKTVNKYNYPYYNEAPGLFALLKTPEIDFNLSLEETTSTIIVGSGVNTQHKKRKNTGIDITLKNGDLDYALNPAAEIDLEKSKIYAAIEFDFYSYPRHDIFFINQSTIGNTWSQSFIYNDFWGIEKNKNFLNLSEFDVPKNDIYKNNVFYLSTTPGKYYTESPLIDNSNNILFPTFYQVNSDIPKFDDAVDLIKKKVTNLSQVCNYRIENVRTDQDPDLNINENTIDPIWANKYKQRILRHTIQTVMVPIENLSQFSFRELFDHLNYMDLDYKHSCNDLMTAYLDPRLKIFAYYTFKPNQYGEVNKTSQIYTYKVKTNLNYSVNSAFTPPSKPLIGKYNTNVTIGNSTYNSNTDIYGKDVIIDGALTITPGVKVTIHASNSVTVVPPSVIPPEVEIIIEPVFEQPVLKPIIGNDLKEYCDLSKNNYKAKEPNNKMAHNSGQNKSKTNLTFYTLHPNPTYTSSSLTIENPISEKANIKVYDYLGREMLNLNAENISVSNNKVTLHTESLSKGLYIVKIMHGDQEKNIHLEVRK